VRSGRFRNLDRFHDRLARLDGCPDHEFDLDCHVASDHDHRPERHDDANHDVNHHTGDDDHDIGDHDTSDHDDHD
jgi:hypothetical protein